MRTISEILRDRFIAQAEEAEVQGLTKIAEHLTSQIEKNDVRTSDEKYSYAEEELKDDVVSALWDAAIRVSDFHDTSLDAVDVQNIIEAAADDFIRDLRVKAGISSGVGVHEPTLPGETKEQVIMELKEDD